MATRSRSSYKSRKLKEPDDSYKYLYENLLKELNEYRTLAQCLYKLLELDRLEDRLDALEERIRNHEH